MGWTRQVNLPYLARFFFLRGGLSFNPPTHLDPPRLICQENWRGAGRSIRPFLFLFLYFSIFFYIK